MQALKENSIMLTHITRLTYIRSHYIKLHVHALKEQNPACIVNELCFHPITLEGV